MMDEAEPQNEDWKRRAEAAETALSKIDSELHARLLLAELKVEAVRAGMVDLDGLKLLDTSGLQLNERGELPDAAAHLTRLKRAKPWLFANQVSSSPAVNPPRPEAPRTRHANELTHEEWLAARAALLRRR